MSVSSDVLDIDDTTAEEFQVDEEGDRKFLLCENFTGF